MSTIFLTEKHLESLMTGEHVNIEGTLAFPVRLVPPDAVRDNCHVSWSLHVATRDRMREDFNSVKNGATTAWETVDRLREQINELETEITRLRLNFGYNA